jgi:hypothetical protein
VQPPQIGISFWGHWIAVLRRLRAQRLNKWRTEWIAGSVYMSSTPWMSTTISRPSDISKEKWENACAGWVSRPIERAPKQICHR